LSRKTRAIYIKQTSLVIAPHITKLINPITTTMSGIGFGSKSFISNLTVFWNADSKLFSNSKLLCSLYLPWISLDQNQFVQQQLNWQRQAAAQAAQQRAQWQAQMQAQMQAQQAQRQAAQAQAMGMQQQGRPPFGDMTNRQYGR
jgi:hypothetical protein